MEQLDVFISHATADDAAVDQIAEALAAANLNVWVDHRGGLGPDVRDWRGNIQDALRACRCGMLVFSPRAVGREEIDMECEYLLKKRKDLPFFLVLLEHVEAEDFPYQLTRLNYTDLTADWQRGMDAVARAIGKRLGLYPPRVTGDYSADKVALRLIGRDTEVQQVETLLAGAGRAVTVRGLGGVGKTRLAAEVVKRAQETEAIEWRDGIIWHKIETHTRPADLTDQLRAHFGLPATAPATEVWEALGTARALLVLDNAEACADRPAYAALLNTLRPDGPARILMTSRARWEELTSNEALLLGEVTADVGVGILREMLHANRPDQRITPAQKAEIACESHYHPRLMEYAVRWLHTYPVSEVVRVLGALEGEDAEEALADMVGRTVEAVKREPGGEAAIATLRRLAVCRGGFTLEAAKALAPLRDQEGHDLLRLLRTWGLLLIEGDRYTIAPLVLKYVGKDPAAHPAHLAYYQQLAQAHHDKQDYVGFAPETANLEAAVEWAIGTGEIEKGYWMVNDAAPFLRNRGRFAQALDWLQRLQVALPVNVPEKLRASLLVSLGNACINQPFDQVKNLRRAIEAFQQALHIYTESDAPHNYAMTQNSLGTAFGQLAAYTEPEQNLRRAIEAYQQALRFYTESDTPLLYAMTQNNVGLVYQNLAAHAEPEQNLRRAIEAYQQALSFYTESDDPLLYATAQNNLGTAYGKLGVYTEPEQNFRRAIEACQQALRFRTEAAAPFEYATTKASLGLIHKRWGDLPAALECWREAERVFRSVGHIPYANQVKGWIDEAEGQASGHS